MHTHTAGPLRSECHAVQFLQILHPVPIQLTRHQTYRDPQNQTPERQSQAELKFQT